MVDSVLFIGTIIIAVTELIKYYVPKVRGPFTIAVAGIVGLVVALVDTHIGVADVTIAQGILTGLSASGVVAVAAKVSGGTPKPE
jgi:type III secretory pathway component EscU